MTGEQFHIVEITGEAGLKNAQEIAGLLTQALSTHNNVVVDTKAATSIDLTILQLLVAARKSALAAGKALRLAAPATGPLRLALTRNGFVAADGRPLTSEGAFWTDTVHP